MKLHMRNIFIFIGIAVVLSFIFSKVFAASSVYAPQKIELNPSNFSAIRDEVNAYSVNAVLQGIVNSDPAKPYYLFLDSPGGKVLDGRRLVTFLQATDRNIVCVAQTAISMAYVILQACPTRVMTNHGILMSHQIAGGAQGSLNDMKAAVAFAQKLADMYDNLIAARMGLTLEAYRAKINPEFWMVGIKEGLDNKAVDAEAKVTCTKELEKQTEVVGEGQNSLKISKCPIAG